MESSLQKLISYHRRNIESTLASLLAIERSTSNAIGAILRDRFLSQGEKERAIGRAREKASKEIAGKVAAAERALEESRKAIAGELDKSPSSDQAQARVRRLLDRKITPAAIVERAQRVGDRETLLSLRDEIRWGLSPGSPTFLASLERTIAAMTPGVGEAFEQLVALTENTRLREAEKLARAATTGDGERVPFARLAYAYATKDNPAPDPGDEGDPGED